MLVLTRRDRNGATGLAALAMLIALSTSLFSQTAASCPAGTVPMPVGTDGKVAQGTPARTKCVTPQEAVQMMMAAQAEIAKKVNKAQVASSATPSVNALGPETANGAAAAVDSALGSAFSKAGATDTALPASGSQPASDAVLSSSQSVARALESGRLVLRAVRFSADGSSMTAPADASIRSIAEAMKTIGGVFAVEAHVPTNGASWSTARAVSSRQAQTFRQALVGAGVTATSVAAVGYGAGRPEHENDSMPRIAIVRLQ